jgi:hypothetical protein
MLVTVGHDHVVTGREQRADDVPADEPRATGDQDSGHAGLRLPTASRHCTWGRKRSRSTR